MEDVFSVAYQQTEDEKDLEYAFFGIFDGHGGREAAIFAKVSPPAIIVLEVLPSSAFSRKFNTSNKQSGTLEYNHQF